MARRKWVASNPGKVWTCSNNWKGWTLALFSRHGYNDGLVRVLIKKELWVFINRNGKTEGRTGLVGMGVSGREKESILDMLK